MVTMLRCTSIMRSCRPLLIGALAFSFAASSQGATAGDPAAGRAVFLVCSACHSAKPAEKNIGPTLYGIVGRKAGTVADFDYSPTLKSASITWTRVTLDAYLKNPAAYVKGNKMAFVGIPDARDRADLIAYLTRLGPAH
jgi:cytochrome c